MNDLRLTELDSKYAAQLADFLAEFPVGHMTATPDPCHIPGTDGLERCGSIAGWLGYCASMRGKITWYLTVRESDGRLIGCACLRHRTEYDDDDPEFASHIGCSVRPSEQGKGFGKVQLGLMLREAARLGIDPVRVICRGSNTASRRIILANGGILRDTLYGEESGFTVCRYDIPTAGL